MEKNNEKKESINLKSGLSQNDIDTLADLILLKIQPFGPPHNNKPIRMSYCQMLCMASGGDPFDLDTIFKFDTLNYLG